MALASREFLNDLQITDSISRQERAAGVQVWECTVQQLGVVVPGIGNGRPQGFIMHFQLFLYLNIHGIQMHALKVAKRLNISSI